MIRLPKLSLRYKFIIPLVLFTIILSITISLISVERFRGELYDQLVIRGREVTTDLINLRWGIRTEGNPLKFNTPYGEIRGYQIIEEDRSWISSIVGASSGMDEILQYPVLSVVRTVDLDGVPHLEIVSVPEPGLHESLATGEEANYVRIFLTFEQVESTTRQAFLFNAGVSFVFILLGLLLAFFLYKNILGPIETLTRSVKLFKSDMHSRAEVNSGDELETLADEFNRMAGTIQERDEILEAMNEDLLKANQVKSEFLSVMGHELKTPLHAIRGSAQLLMEEIDGPVTDAQKEDLSNIMKSGDHLRALIDNILQFSKIESGEETIHPHDVEVGKLVEEAIQQVTVLARQKKIGLSASTNGIRVTADETKLKQVLINLISNALKYTNDGHVNVNVTDNDEEVIFSIQDTGVGIPKDKYESVFEPFTQLDSSTTREWGGIGLGLSIVKKYVEMHGGRIWLESEVDRGTTFYFTIPAIRELIESGGQIA
jgi:signal transduction histidine kinase